MIKLLVFFLIIGHNLFPELVFGLNNISEKRVNLHAGQMTLGATLKTISSQTSCVFSYDPTNVPEKQVVNVPPGFNYPLHLALSKILPSNIHFKFKEKYILLFKSATPQPKVKPTKNVEIIKISKNVSQLNIDSLNTKDMAVVVPRNDEPVFTTSKPSEIISTISESSSNNAPTPPDQPKELITAELKTLQPIKSSSIKSKQSFGKILLRNTLLEAEIATYNNIAAASLHVGFYDIYAIMAFGKNKDQVTTRGIGLGGNLQVYKDFGAIVELVRETQLTGKTYDLGVRTELTTIKPLLKYTIGKSVSIFGGPTFNMFNSKYINAVKTYDLGKTFYYGAIIGVKMDLVALFSKNS